MANLTDASVVGTAGDTVVLATVAVESTTTTTTANNNNNNNNNNNSLLHPPFTNNTNHHSSSSSSSFLTVSYEERHHGVGRIPTSTPSRRDNVRLSTEEVLASRAMDRALRPLLSKSTTTQQQQHIHVHCSVQSHNVFAESSGHPVALALNAASAALLKHHRLQEAVACVHVTGCDDGTVCVDPTPAQVERADVELLYAATSNGRVVMMEASASPTLLAKGIPNDDLMELVQVAHAAVQPLLDIQTQLWKNAKKEEEDEVDEQGIRAELGLLPVLDDEKEEDHVAVEDDSLDSDGDNENDSNSLWEDAYQFCRDALKDAPRKLFGNHDDRSEKRPGPLRENAAASASVSIHPADIPLLSKSLRGRREHVVFTEIQRLLREEFVPKEPKFQQDYQQLVRQQQGNGDNNNALSLLARSIHHRLLQSALFVQASLFENGTRGDGRIGRNPCHTIRPISLSVPALPDPVHGSALFARGETQVLCTATLGAPRDGLPLRNPYTETTDPRNVGTEAAMDKGTGSKQPQQPQPQGPFDDLPVGSLRFLKSQEALLSDLNSRKVRADREQTGDSGTLDEVQRFFLHYYFPSYSTGEISAGGGGGAANRRAIGHGALAEKALRPAMPHPSEFPYAIRVTSEVTDSNGSSSMATVCGATLALLDAGVPIQRPIAGVSVGIALDNEQTDDTNEMVPYRLLLDITGTEDHYGAMDCKVAGSDVGVTALQLDVKKPLPLHVLSEALDLAREGRKAILKEMKELADSSSHGIVRGLQPRAELKESAPRVEVIRFDPLRKRDLIGPGGAVLRQLEDRFGVSLDLSQEGQCLLTGANPRMVAKAKSAVMDLVADVEEGGIYEGTVIEIKDFGAIVELLRNKEGLLHVSELADDVDISKSYNPGGNLGAVRDILRIGQKIEVLCTGVDRVNGSIRLSRKALLRQRKTSNKPE